MVAWLADSSGLQILNLLKFQNPKPQTLNRSHYLQEEILVGGCVKRDACRFGQSKGQRTDCPDSNHSVAKDGGLALKAGL